MQQLHDANLNPIAPTGLWTMVASCGRINNWTIIGICSARHPFAGQTISFEQLLGETVVVREHGSGTRSIFENELHQRGYSLGMFRRQLEVGSFHLISRLISENLGISFAYRPVIANKPDIATFQVEGFAVEHEFNIVTLPYAATTKTTEEFLRYL